MIAVLVPVLARPHQVQRLINSFRAATSYDDATLYFIAQYSDAEEIFAIRSTGFEPLLVHDEDRSWGRKINRGYERTTEPWMFLAADDSHFHLGWVDAVRKLMHLFCGVVGVNDCTNSYTLGVSSTVAFVCRRYVDEFGAVDELNKVLHEGYEHNFVDSELVNTAKIRGLYVHCARCRVEHLHPGAGKGEWDRTHAIGQEAYWQDRELFFSRGSRFGWR